MVYGEDFRQPGPHRNFRVWEGFVCVLGSSRLGRLEELRGPSGVRRFRRFRAYVAGCKGFCEAWWAAENRTRQSQRFRQLYFGLLHTAEPWRASASRASTEMIWQHCRVASCRQAAYACSACSMPNTLLWLSQHGYTARPDILAYAHNIYIYICLCQRSRS